LVDIHLAVLEKSPFEHVFKIKKKINFKNADFRAVFTIWYRIYPARSKQHCFLEVYSLGRHVGFSASGYRQKVTFCPNLPPTDFCK